VLAVLPARARLLPWWQEALVLVGVIRPDVVTLRWSSERGE
jgi:hypothetical protein